MNGFRRGTILVGGSVAQKPGYGGHTWVYLQYLLGLRRLGFEAILVDRLERGMCLDANGSECDPADSVNVAYLVEALRCFGLERSFSLLLDDGSTLGLPRAELLERARGSAFLLNVMGFITDDEVLAAVPRRVFLDIDPGFGQMWRELGLHDAFAGHDDHVTIGERIGTPGCAIPTCGIDWITTPQPVVLEHWPQTPVPGGGRITSVASWRGAYAPLEYGGRTYGLRVHEFRKFVELPRLARHPFELALAIHDGDARDRDLLLANGWELVEPRRAAGDPAAYRAYLQGSAAEFMVAKNAYVELASGWVSDRSICYLASGRPVIAQDTGLDGLYPTGEGLLTFETLDEALACVEDVFARYERHARAARQLAEERFDSDVVLQRLLDRLGVA